MDKISIKEIIKITTRNYSQANPFSDDFDREELFALIKTTADEYSADYEIVSEDINKSLDVIMLFNDIYEDIMTEIEDEIEQLNLSRKTLSELVLTVINWNYISVLHSVEEQMANSSSQSLTIDDFVKSVSTIKDAFGTETKGSDALDISIDTCNELLRIIWSLSEKKNTRSVEHHSIKRLVLLTSILVNIKNAFEYYRYEFAVLDINDTRAKVSHEPNWYFYIRTIGSKREANLITEGSIISTQLSFSKLSICKTSIQNGNIIIHNEHIEEAPNAVTINSSVLITFYSHLIELRFKIQEDFSIKNIFDFIVVFRVTIQNLSLADIHDKSIQTQRLDTVPFKIKKSALVKYLARETKLATKTVEQLLGYISTTFSHEINLWETPLISYSDYYYVTLHPVAHGQIAHQVDRILQHYVPVKEQECEFKKMISESLSNFAKYKFSQNDSDYVRTLLRERENILLYEMSSVIVLLKICLFNYPLSSYDYHNCLVRIGDATDELNQVNLLIAQNISEVSTIDKPAVVSIVLTNHPSLSGLYIGDCFLMDYYLLNNYLSVGAYRRGFLTSNKGVLDSQEIAAYSYYNTEDEFNTNLIDFCSTPTPIHEIANEIQLKEYPISPKEIHPQIFQDGLEFVSFKSVIRKQIKDLELHLKQLFYFEKPIKQSLTLERRQRLIEYILAQVSSAIAISKEDRYDRITLINVFKATGMEGIPYLLKVMNDAHLLLISKNIKKDAGNIKSATLDSDKAEKQLESILHSLIGKEISLSSIELKLDYSDEDIDNLISYLQNILSAFAPKRESEEELETQLRVIVILVGIAQQKEKYEEHVHSALLNFIDALNFNDYYQKARDFAEEILEYSFRTETVPIIGWLCLFKCYTKQSNAIESACYGILYHMALIAQPEIPRYQVVNALFNSMLFYRDFHFFDFAERLYKALASIDLLPYDRQKIQLSYFTLKLLEPTEINEKFISDVKEYVDNSLEAIISYGQLGALPWLNFLYNLKKVTTAVSITKTEFIEEFIKRLENEIDPATLQSVQASHFPMDNISKEMFLNALIRTFETRYFDDLASEINRLEPLANNVIRASLFPLDLNSLLLSGIVKNDNTLTFNPIDSALRAPFLKGESGDIANKLSNYSATILNGISLKKGQILCWLFEIDNRVYAIQINHEKAAKLYSLVHWDLNTMHDWLNRIDEFSFNDKGGYFINEQEQDYANLLKELSFANIMLEDTCEELLISTDLTLSLFPSNLVECDIDITHSNYALHEDSIQEYIDKKKSDFISFHKPITNVVTLEWYSQNGVDIRIKKEELTLEAWVPIADNDFVLNIGYTKLQPVVIDKYKGIIHTEVIPEHPLSSVINVFLAHGGKGIDGFRTIYTRQDEDGKALVKGKGVKTTLGSGSIAVLFVCNSASISKQFYIQKLVSFVYEVLSLGYKTVIAPAWSLNPDISGIWLDSFITNLLLEDTVGVAAQKANVQVAKNGYNEYHGFYAPTGWAAMHVYGNPNISFIS